MSTINGLPAHVLLVHFVVVLAPLTAILAIVCAVWPAARQRLVWLVLVLALVTTALTPLTVEAGEWLEHRIGSSPALEIHAERGGTMLYFAPALLAAAILLAVGHLRTMSTVARAVIAAMVITASAATIVAVIRIGDSAHRPSGAASRSTRRPRISRGPQAASMAVLSGNRVGARTGVRCRSRPSGVALVGARDGHGL